MSAEWKLTPTKRRARYYKLIAAGRQQLGVEQSTFARRVDSIASVMQPEGWHVAGMDAASSRFTPSCSSATFAPPGCRSSTRGTRRSGSSWRSPGFSITVVLTLALGIGATVTMLSVLDHVLLRPLIYAHDDRLVALYQKGTEGHERIVSYPTFLDWAHADVGFAGMSFVRGDRLTLATANGPRHVGTAFVSRGFFKLMGTSAEIGRTFVPEEERQSGVDAIVLSPDIWVRDFAADPRVIGRVVSVDSESAVVVGVMLVGFAFPSWGEIWRPLGQILGRDSVLERRGVYADIRAVRRLAPDVDLARATARLAAVQRRSGAWSWNIRRRKANGLPRRTPASCGP